MSSKVSKLVRIALAASIAASGAIATTAFTTSSAVAATTAVATTSSSVDGQITRSEVITRAQYWLDKGLTYNQSGSYPDSSGRNYRTDCSGYVSMAWHLGASPSTQFLPGYSTEISRSDLKPGDILNSFYDHVILFEKWDDAAHTKFSYYSFGSTPVKHNSNISINAATFDSHPNGDYKALRYNKIVDDPTAPSTYSGDLPVSGRWSNGSATTVGVFRNGTWALRETNGNTIAVGFGQAGDLPMTGDFDGVGHDQLGVFRPSSSTFVVRHDDTSVTSLSFGQAGDLPVPGMWDHNGHAQMAVYRPGTGTFVVRHDDGSVSTVALGQAGDTPIVGDWDGVGHTQMGVFRPGATTGSQNTVVLRHDDGSVTTAAYGVKGDLPVAGDWSSQGRATYGVYRPGTATFALSNAYAGTADSVFTYGNGGTWS
ncbi:hypothetical protein [Kitasatospora purpeofusca]|uniref:hypothetical protein n=1 Tax=Kitasatospora purpeofusca TaxID=67352 RepID=UPI0038692E8C